MSESLPPQNGISSYKKRFPAIALQNVDHSDSPREIGSPTEPFCMLVATAVTLMDQLKVVIDP